MVSAIDLPLDWEAALARVAEARLTLVLGAADVGKSSFIHAALGAGQPRLELLDLDPGQKMVGPPGSVSLGNVSPDGLQLGRFVFTGSTSASTLRYILSAGQALAEEARSRAPLIANTSGFVRGLGARLQWLTIEALRPDLIVAIEQQGELDPILEKVPAIPVARISKSPLARRKTASERRRVRQAALDEALAGAEPLLLPRETPFVPAPPALLAGATRPICALADENGQDMALGVLEAVTSDAVRLLGPRPPRPIRRVTLGRMWVEPFDDGGWRLLEKLSPAWVQPEAA